MKSVAAEAFDSGVFKIAIPYSNIIAKSHGSRQSIHEYAPDHVVANSYDRVALAVGRFIGQNKKK